MLKVAVVIPGSATTGFFSQVAATARALRVIEWSRWTPKLYAYLGDWGADSYACLARWAPYLRDVTIVATSQADYESLGNWAQCDEIFRLIPSDSDVVLGLDADALPVGNFESLLDEVVARNAVAGVMAHYPFPAKQDHRELWNEFALSYLGESVPFTEHYSLLPLTAQRAQGEAPFYLNGGVVFYARDAFVRFRGPYLNFRKRLMAEMDNTDFVGQVAFTLAVAHAKIEKIVLPMRYNFPNDPIADDLHAEELRKACFYHYLRTRDFDRQRIFTSEEEFRSFMSLTLSGSNELFRQNVVRIFNGKYPF